MSIPSSSSSAQFTYTAAASTTTNNSYFPLPFHLQQTDPTSSSQYPQPYVAPAAAVPPAPVVPAVYPAPVASYTLPQYHQAQQLFQRDAQTITPEALESVKAALASSEIEHKAEAKKKAVPRKAAGQSWEDPTLAEWPENDYRLFCGDLGNEVNDDVLSKAFSRFPSFNMARVSFLFSQSLKVLRYQIFLLAMKFFISCSDNCLKRTEKSILLYSKVVRDKRTGKTKGYGFVSFSNPSDLAAALKEMNGKYVGNRPIKLRKSKWRERTDFDAMERQKNQYQKKSKPSRKSIFHK